MILEIEYQVLFFYDCRMRGFCNIKNTLFLEGYKTTAVFRFFVDFKDFTSISMFKLNNGTYLSKVV